MVNKLLCLYEYISQTETGDRNTNLFKALSHLRKYNKNVTEEDFIEEALLINKEFESPLGENEVVTVCKHAMSKNYHSTCWKFQQYCRHCRHGEFRKIFRNSKPNYWKHLNNNNQLVGIKLIEDDTYYPWDIIDTSKLSDIEIETGDGKRIMTKEEQKARIQMFREQMGIPIDIDKIVKNYGIPVGDEALNEWNKFRESD